MISDLTVAPPCWKMVAFQCVLTIVADYIARFMVQIHVNKTYIVRLPIPQPTTYDIKNTPEYRTLTENSLKLCLSNSFDCLADLAAEFGVTREDVELTDKQKERLQIDNDLIVAKMYGITAEDMQHK